MSNNHSADDDLEWLMYKIGMNEDLQDVTLDIGYYSPHDQWERLCACLRVNRRLCRLHLEYAHRHAQYARVGDEISRLAESLRRIPTLTTLQLTGFSEHDEADLLLCFFANLRSSHAVGQSSNGGSTSSSSSSSRSNSSSNGSSNGSSSSDGNKGGRQVDGTNKVDSNNSNNNSSSSSNNSNNNSEGSLRHCSSLSLLRYHDLQHLSICTSGGMHELYPALFAAIRSIPTLRTLRLEFSKPTYFGDLFSTDTVVAEVAIEMIVESEYAPGTVVMPDSHFDTTFHRASQSKVQSLELDVPISLASLSCIARALECSHDPPFQRLRFACDGTSLSCSDRGIEQPADEDDRQAAVASVIRAFRKHASKMECFVNNRCIDVGDRQRQLASMEQQMIFTHDNLALQEYALFRPPDEQTDLHLRLNRAGRKLLYHRGRSGTDAPDQRVVAFGLLAAERDDLDCLYYFLTECPELCHVECSTSASIASPELYDTTVAIDDCSVLRAEKRLKLQPD